MNQIKTRHILALDIGSVRVGLALANSHNYLARPLATILNDDSFESQLNQVILTNEVNILVVGWPRNLAGEETNQSEYVKKFVTDKLEKFNLPIFYQDETLTTVKAQELLDGSNKNYHKLDIDAYAAAVILEDYLIANNKI